MLHFFCVIFFFCFSVFWFFFFFQAEDGIRDAQESRGLGDVYKRQGARRRGRGPHGARPAPRGVPGCLLYTSDAADDLTRVDLGGRRIIKKKKKYIFFFSSRRRHTRCSGVSWARRCV